MISEEDFYNSNTAPNAKVNPKTLGSMWINYDNGNFYICNDNTFNKNVWLDPVGDMVKYVNEKISNIKSLGINQKWYNVLSERSYGVTYHNTGNTPIMVSIKAGYNRAAGGKTVNIWVDDVVVVSDTGNEYGHRPDSPGITCVIPAGSTYKATGSHIGPQLWFELR